MSSRKLIVGNWKMNTTLSEAIILAEGIKEGLSTHQVAGIDVVLCPPFPWIVPVAEALSRHRLAHLKVGAQDVSWQEEGTYTGEVSAPMLKGLVDYVIVGHSERRQHFHETDQEVLAKVRLAIKFGLKPILCVGELKPGSIRLAIEQLEAVIKHLTKAEREELVVAYEPVWAISKGKSHADAVGSSQAEQPVSASGLSAQSVANQLRQLLPTSTPILYGGSVSAENAREFLTQPDIDGVLVGGASLKVSQFIAICRSAIN